MSNRLTLRFCPADEADGAISTADIGQVLIAVDAVIQAFADAPNGDASRRSVISRLSLVQADGRDCVLQLDVDGANDAPLARLVASAAAVLAGEPCEAEPELRDLRRAIPQGIRAVELAHDAASASISRGESSGEPPPADQWILDLVHRMTHHEAKPFVPYSDDERLDFDVEEFNRMVAEGRRSGG